MFLNDLIQSIEGVQLYGPSDIEVEGISNHTAAVKPRDLFIARKGSSSDARTFVDDAIHSGAVAVATDLYNPEIKVTQVIHPDIRFLEANLSAHFYGSPQKKLFLAGVTGTKGKTTSSFILKHLLESTGRKTGLMGTIEIDTGGERRAAKLTTADVLTNYAALSEMVDHQLDAAVLEVSSHALDQGRVAGMLFDLALYTNLYDDHLDYHGDMDSYAKAKGQLFEQSRSAVFNSDCPYAEKVIGKTKVKRLSYGMRDADLQISSVEQSIQGSTWKLSYQGEGVEFQSSMVGMHNIYNITGCIGMLLIAGVALSELVQPVKEFSHVPGRLERVENSRGLSLFVDFAHTGIALEQVIDSLRPYCRGKIMVVFGCGGDRSPGRRESMAKAADGRADQIFITSDNPRSESPEKIVEEIFSFISAKEKVTLEVDRKKAIEKAVESATPDDIVIIAGKGHEKFQIFENRTVEFDDVDVARRACEAKTVST